MKPDPDDLKSYLVSNNRRLLSEAELLSIREQTQEDIISFIESYNFISHPEFLKDNLCDIVLENFKKLE